jgi:hypothetical protein
MPGGDDVRLHFGSPQFRGGFRFRHGTLSAQGRSDRACYFEHPIKWWFGISFARLFVGIVRTHRTVETLEEMTMPGCPCMKGAPTTKHQPWCGASAGKVVEPPPPPREPPPDTDARF